MRREAVDVKPSKTRQFDEGAAGNVADFAARGGAKNG
jgi:hypothetical protein